jgi:ribonuclease D
LFYAENAQRIFAATKSIHNPMKPELIQSRQSLADCVSELKKSDELSVDLEFDKNRYRYGFNLCLMQIATPNFCFIIDPLTEELDVSPVFPILESRERDKVVFAFGEDLRLLHSMDCFPRGLIDLRMATSLLNYPPASLTNLLNEILDVQLGQSAQNSNWFIRPLTANQLEYAADDVLYLSALRERVEKEAKEKGILHWVEQENEFMENQSHADVANNALYRPKDKMGLSAYTWGVLEHLLNFREEIAAEVNRPGYQVIHKDYLIELANDSEALKQWDKVRGIHRKVQNSAVKNRLREALEKAHQQAKAQGLSETADALPRPTPEESRKRREEKARMDQLKQTIFDPIKKQLKADYGENAATFILSNRNINDIIMGDFSSMRPYKEELLLKYGKDLGIDVAPLLKPQA